MGDRTVTGGGAGNGLPDAVARYVSERAALIADAAPSAASARRLSALTDEALRALAASAADIAPKRWTMLALGGYGAGRLLPASDLDLLLLVEGETRHVKPFVNALLYPLWDAGLKVGHQVRSRKEHLRQCRDDLDTLTATLRGRVLAGDAEAGERLLGDVAEDAAKRRRKVLPALTARVRDGSPYLLEPDLKEQAGGQRDLDELAWLAAVLTGRPTADFEPLVALGVLSAEESASLRAAADLLAAARWALHVAAPRPTSRLTLDLADDLGVDLHALQRSLADVHELLLAARRRVLGGAPAAPLASADDVFAAAARGDLEALERWAWDGSLDRYVPGFLGILSLRRPGLSHRFTVGAHCLRAACVAARRPDERFGAAAFDALADRRPLVAAALVHDLGKRESAPGHEARGAEEAPGHVQRLGLDPAAAADVATLVRRHLLLAKTAASADIDDEEVVLATAAKVGDRDLVGPLYLLTAADSQATGEGAWTPWHAALVGELASRLDAALSSDVEGAGVLATAAAVRADAIASAMADDRLASAIRTLPVRYLARYSAAEAVRDARLALRLVDGGDKTASELVVSSGPIDDTWRLTVIAFDRHGLFADVAGVLALAGLDILAAEAYPGPAGTGLDVFTVRSATLAPPKHATWASVERYLSSALGTGLALDVRLAERRRHYSSNVRRRRTQVEVDTSTPYATGITVVAADRVGLLHDVARAITESGYDIRWANAFGKNGTVRDTFHVIDPDGLPPRDPGELGHVAMRIRERTAPERD